MQKFRILFSGVVKIKKKKKKNELRERRNQQLFLNKEKTLKTRRISSEDTGWNERDTKSLGNLYTRFPNSMTDGR